MVAAYLGSAPPNYESLSAYAVIDRRTLVKGAPHQVAVGRRDFGRRSYRGHTLYIWTVFEYRAFEYRAGGEWQALRDSFEAEVDPMFHHRPGSTHPIAVLAEQSLAVHDGTAWRLLSTINLALQSTHMLVEPDGEHLLWAAAWKNTPMFGPWATIGNFRDVPAGVDRLIFGRCSIGKPGSGAAPAIDEPSFAALPVQGCASCPLPKRWDAPVEDDSGELGETSCLCWDGEREAPAAAAFPGDSSVQWMVPQWPPASVLLVRYSKFLGQQSRHLFRANLGTMRCTAVVPIPDFHVLDIAAGAALRSALLLGYRLGSGHFAVRPLRSEGESADCPVDALPFSLAVDTAHRRALFDVPAGDRIGTAELPAHLFAPPVCHPACACRAPPAPAVPAADPAPRAASNAPEPAPDAARHAARPSP